MNTKISVTSLFASSSGNAIYVKSGNTELLIDAGVCAKSICSALHGIGTDISNIQGIFITHEHSDHIKGLTVISKKYGTPIHMTEKSAAEYLYKNPKPQNFNVHKQDYEYSLGNITIRSFFSPHDSAACVGYIVETPDDKFGIATDMGYVDRAAVNALLGCNSVILESNYDQKMLENGEYPYSLKQRIMSARGHLSNYDCAAFARYLAERGTKNFMLSHLSTENNTPDIAFNISSRALADFDGITLKVAEKDKPTFFI